MNLPSYSVRYLIKILSYAKGGLTISKEEATKGIGFLSPRKATEKSKTLRRARSARKTTKIAAKRMTTGEIRAACMELAGGFCECGCGRPFDEEGFSRKPELDHFFGRVGPQSVATCWILIRLCHWEKTHNEPDKAFWNAAFITRCLRNGLPVPKALRVEHAPVPRRSA